MPSFNDASNKAHQAFLEKFAAAHPQAPPFTSTDPAETAEYVVKHAASGTARQWLSELMEETSPSPIRGKFGVVMLAIAGAIVGGSLIFGIFFRPTFLGSLGTPQNARGLITFLFAFATIAVILISAIATFWVKIDEVEKRGALAKEILTILIGIMGTILGFYFGSLQNDAPPPTEPPAAEAGAASE